MKNMRKIAAAAAAALFIMLSQCMPVRLLFNTPEQMTIYENEIDQIEEQLEGYQWLGQTSRSAGINQQTLFKYIKTENGGVGSYDLKLMGVTLRQVNVQVRPEKEVYVGGQCVGVAMYTKGILVIDRADIQVSENEKRNPGLEAGLRIGDFIEKANNVSLQNVSDFNKVIEGAKDKPIALIVRRGEQTLQLTIQPALDQNEKKYRLGLWLRDSTAGIGTVTYVNPSSLEFVALGHPISDGDTGVILPVGQGSIVECRLNAIEKGKTGTPGELKGSFSTDANQYGDIIDNCSYGLYGVLKKSLPNALYPNPIPIGSRDMVREGKATILSTIDGNGIQEYEVEIVKANRQSTRAPKGMIIKVTDKRLLEKTGGIVQGMSGSPILQNGHLIGAVTHVLISDPTKGYGLYIDWMFNE